SMRDCSITSTLTRCRSKSSTGRTSGSGSDVLVIAMPSLAAGEAAGAADAFVAQAGLPVPILFAHGLADRLAPGAMGRVAVGEHTFAREAGDLLRQRLGR